MIFKNVSKSKLTLAFISIVITFFVWQQGLRDSLNRPSVSFDISQKEQEINPDISTEKWDLHKLRLDKFKRSQYKGLTFFVSSENKIYYLSEEGDKVYC